jgi:hypothetical protein
VYAGLSPVFFRDLRSVPDPGRRMAGAIKPNPKREEVPSSGTAASGSVPEPVVPPQE